MVNKSKRRARGRPKSVHAEDVRQGLLAAARELFLRYGYRDVSSRQIAAAAGANVAMIRYYFGGKPGLYREMIEGQIAPMRARIDAMRLDTASVDLTALMANMARMYAANPWLAGIIVREVLSPDGTLRTIFLRDIVSRLVPVVEQIVAGEIERGRLRVDLDPRLVVLSMVSLAAFPFLTMPITSRVFGVSADEEFLGRFTRHITRVFQNGCAAPEKNP
jgi:AcrR family transcriptional regulator